MRRTSVSIAAASLLVLALAVTAYAAKRIYKARLSSQNELHQLYGSPSAGGSAVLSTAINGSSYNFQVFVRGLTGDAWSVDLHGPADANGTAPVIVRLCGEAPSALGYCPPLDAEGNLDISGSISSSLAQQWGLSGANFRNWLDSGLVYADVKTGNNPDGEARGQFLQIYP